MVNRSTKDIYLSAAWMALGAKFEKVDRTDPRHQEFFFSSGKADFTDLLAGEEIDLNEIEKQWANEDLRINAVHFKNALQRMKALVHSA